MKVGLKFYETKEKAQEYITNKGYKTAVIVERTTDRSDSKFTRKLWLVAIDRSEYNYNPNDDDSLNDINYDKWFDE